MSHFLLPRRQRRVIELPSTLDGGMQCTGLLYRRRQPYLSFHTFLKEEIRRKFGIIVNHLLLLLLLLQVGYTYRRIPPPTVIVNS